MENKDELPFGNETIVHNGLRESEETWAPACYLDMLSDTERTEIMDVF